ncbi:tRNA-dihydrouridine synthase family protein [Candidatus Peregrinibacteria bacterium]|nr:tRNA-dihydrouridine synthase family protein [Candidatus Peregrinibacteria bacterium]
MFNWDFLPRPIIALAPMSGYTDCAFRQIVKKLCPEVICFTEFTSIDGLLYGNEATRRQIKFNKKERPIIAQIFGKKPENFKTAAKILTELGVDAIDINMGCPARKIVNADYGSALLKNPSLATEIVQATTESTSLPVSVKMRIGISKYDEEYFLNFGLGLQKAGAKLITVHGRLAKQMYVGFADWNPIYELKKILKIPVIGNGDIKNGTDATRKLKKLDGIMVGRGALGNPWIFQEIAADLQNKPFISPSFETKIKLIKKHVALACKLHGEQRGILEMRKQLMHYIRGIPKASAARQRLCTVSTINEVFEVLSILLLIP